MATCQKSIFQDLSPSLDYSVNPYAKVLASNRGELSLPLAFGSDLKGKAGQWRSYFEQSGLHGSSPRKLILEIGCHKGKTINQMASNHPDLAFVGMDITFKRVVLSARLAVQSQNNNVCAVLGDARQIDQIFAAEELDGIVAFFPDPWLKKRSQANKKLFNDDFLVTLSQRLKPHGQFWFKTDAEAYFAELKSSASKAGLVQVDRSQGMLTGDYETTFEAMFKNQNLPTFEALWTKF
ncbi:MAG: hypothetical protein HRU09_09580 [Oligoflexales bacterium]|nr:hypothetical protein [Oligoflexales bacterium]